MSYERLLLIAKPFFSRDEVAHILGVQLDSASVLLHRYMKKGLVTRLKRGLYARTEVLERLEFPDLFRISNILQVPSYVSLYTALSFFGITTQMQRNYVEAISLKRTRYFRAGRFTFRFARIRHSLYGGFLREEGMFIASPEKAFLDVCYLASLGRYRPDIPSLDLGKLDRKKIDELADPYPSATSKYLRRIYDNAE
ncbi:MAG: type IV toxin-antitoxin system AbiEi family antitoxin domain-containing protein [Desulfatiglandaceae bacterium]|jgi:hypothetical protein